MLGGPLGGLPNFKPLPDPVCMCTCVCAGRGEGCQRASWGARAAGSASAGCPRACTGQDWLAWSAHRRAGRVLPLQTKCGRDPPAGVKQQIDWMITSAAVMTQGTTSLQHIARRVQPWIAKLTFFWIEKLNCMHINLLRPYKYLYQCFAGSFLCTFVLPLLMKNSSLAS